jgi:hypothetical protein
MQRCRRAEWQRAEWQGAEGQRGRGGEGERGRVAKETGGEVEGLHRVPTNAIRAHILYNLK